MSVLVEAVIPSFIVGGAIGVVFALQMGGFFILKK